MTKQEAEWIESAHGRVLSCGTLSQGSALGAGKIELVLDEVALIQFDSNGRGSACLIEVPLDLLVPDFSWRPADA